MQYRGANILNLKRSQSVTSKRTNQNKARNLLDKVHISDFRLTPYLFNKHGKTQRGCAVQTTQRRRRRRGRRRRRRRRRNSSVGFLSST